MRYIVLGAGNQGTACAIDLLANPETVQVTIVDREEEPIQKVVGRLELDRVETQVIDCSQADVLVDTMRGHNVAISALPSRLNFLAARAAVDAGIGFVDLGSDMDMVLSQLRLAPAAKTAGVTLVPDCGLAPGLCNVLVADAVAELEQVTDVKIRVGGLPAYPEPPWNYFMMFPFEGLMDEYTGTAEVLRDWNRTGEPALTGDERLVFPDPVGECEASFTAGGSSTLPWTYAGRIRNLDYKTVRYPGHYDKLRALRSLGFFNTEKVVVDGSEVAPRDLLKALFLQHLNRPDDPDVVVLRVESAGVRAGKKGTLRHEMMDLRNEETGLTAMMRTTAFPVSIVAQMIANGTIARKGAFTPEMVVPPAEMIAELELRGVFIRRDWKENG